MIKNLTVLLILGSLLIGCEQKTDSKEILFVCTHGAARSPISAAYFNKIAEEKGLNYHAVFRGTEPDEVLSKETVVGLTNDEFDVNEWKPEMVTTVDMERAFKVVTFDCVLPSVNHELNEENWSGIPSISKDYDKARNAIRLKVEELIDSL